MHSVSTFVQYRRKGGGVSRVRENINGKTNFNKHKAKDAPNPALFGATRTATSHHFHCPPPIPYRTSPSFYRVRNIQKRHTTTPKTKRHTTTHKTSGTFSNFQRHLLVGSLNLYDNPSTNNHTL